MYCNTRALRHKVYKIHFFVTAKAIPLCLMYSIRVVVFLKNCNPLLNIIELIYYAFMMRRHCFWLVMGGSKKVI